MAIQRLNLRGIGKSIINQSIISYMLEVQFNFFINAWWKNILREFIIDFFDIEEALWI